MDQDLRKKQYEQAHPTDELIRIKRYNRDAINKIVDLQEKAKKDKLEKANKKQEAMLSDMADHFLHNEVNSPREIKKRVDDIKKANA